MNQVNFGSCLDMGVNDAGLYLVPMIIFRLFHKPLLIPWREIQVEPFKWFFSRGYRLTFRSVPGVSLEIHGATFDKMMEYLKAQTGFEQPDQPWGK